MHTVFSRYLWGGLVVLLCGWLQYAAAASGEGAVDALFPTPDATGEDATAKATDDAERETFSESLEKVEERLQKLEDRLGPSRRLRPSPATSVERRLEDMERRLTRLEQDLRQLQRMDQRIRRLETQR